MVPDDPCPMCGYRREHLRIDGATWAKCPNCQDLRPCD